MEYYSDWEVMVDKYLKKTGAMTGGTEMVRDANVRGKALADSIILLSEALMKGDIKETKLGVVQLIYELLITAALAGFAVAPLMDKYHKERMQKGV